MALVSAFALRAQPPVDSRWMLLQARTGAPPEARIGSLAAVRRPSGETIALVALVLLAAALRFSTLTDQSYWLDEAQAAHELGLSLPSMLGAWSAAEWNPPLYLLVAWPWAHVLGTGPGALRSLSALLGVGLVVLVYLCGRELVSGAAGLVAAALAAVDPFTIWYSQEAREYSLLLVLCAASLLSFARAHRAGARRDLLWWAVLSALAILTQYFAGFLVFAEGALLLRRSRSRTALAACAAQVAVLVPFVPHLLPRLRQPALFITSVPLGRRIQEVPVAFALAAVLVAAMAWGEAKVQSDPLYQRPNWRGVAAALGAQEGTRAIAAYPGQFATGPLSWYLPRVPWAGPGGRTPAGPVTVSELDVIANAAGPPPAPPAAARVIAAPVVDGYQIVRYALAAPVRGDAGALAALAERLFPVPGLAPQVIVQRAAPR